MAFKEKKIEISETPIPEEVIASIPSGPRVFRVKKGGFFSTGYGMTWKPEGDLVTEGTSEYEQIKHFVELEPLIG